MKKTIISIIIIGCLLSTTILNVSGEEAIGNTKDVGIIVIQTPSSTFNYNKNSMTDYSYTFSKTDLNSIDSTETPSQSGSLDFAITELNAWYCPFPPDSVYVGWKYECYKFEIDNIGNSYTGSGQIQVLFTIIRADGSEHTYSMMSGEYDGIFFKNILIIYHAEFTATPPKYCNAIKARLEIITTLPDNNPLNNVLTVDWTTGVTFLGQVHEKDISGNTNYVDYAEVISDSDCDKVIGSDKVTSFGTPCIGDQHPFYTMVAPKEPDKPAYKYKITAQTGLFRKQTKYSEPLSGMSYKEIFFTFFKLDSQNSQSSQQSNPTQNTQSSPTQQTQPSTQPSATQSIPSATTPTSKTATTATTATSTTTTSKITSLPASR